MATVRKRGDKYYYRFKVKNGDSYKWIERGDNFRTKKEALEAGTKAEAEWNTRLSVWEPRKVLYKKMLEEWNENWCNVQYKGSTLDSIRKDIKIVEQYLGANYIHLITPMMMQEVLTNMAERHYSRNRIGKVKSLMYKSMRWAVEQAWLKNNPATSIYVPTPRASKRLGCAPKKELRALEKEEVERILDRFGKGSSAYIPLLLGYRCGLRLGEVFGLEVSDFDKDKRCLNVRQQLGYHGSDLVVSEPKYESKRVIRLDDDTSRLLEEHVMCIQAVKMVSELTGNYKRYYLEKDGVVTENPAVQEVDFLNRRIETGELISPRIMQHVGRVVHGCEGAFNPPITDWTFHQMRHTHCSELLASGFDVEYVPARLGHKDAATTWRYYAHLVPAICDKSEKMIERFYQNCSSVEAMK